MTGVAVARAQESTSPKLVIKEANREIRRLYVRLFWRSVLAAASVFAVVRGVSVFFAVHFRGSTLALLVALALGFAGNSLLTGALVEVVKDLHEDGDRVGGIGEMFRRATGKLRPLLGVSLLSGFGIGLGLLLLVIPGVVLMVRWAVAVPVVMIEGRSPRQALRRSRELVRGNGRAVLNVLLAVGLLTGFVGGLVGVLARHQGVIGFWAIEVLAGALTAPYASHAVTVLYYRLIDPERPAALPRGQRWQSIWEQERAAAS